MLSAGETHAQTWLAAPATNDWNTATNWTPNVVPELPGDTAIFGVSATLNPTINTAIAPDGITFNLGASTYTIENVAGITFFGAGILNNSVATQTINVADFSAMDFFGSATGGNNTAGGAVVINNGNSFITFFNTSTAGDVSTTYNNNDPLSLIGFFDSSSAGSAIFNNVAASGAFPGASINFFGSSTAANATITNIGANSNTSFSDTSTAGNSTISNVGAGSSTDFFASASAGTATISNDTDGTFITFSTNSTAAGSTLNNNTASFIDFFDNATAGNSQINNIGAGFIEFFNSASGGSSTINNTNPLGLVTFFDTSTAGGATINNTGSGGSPATSSLVAFFNSSSAGSSQIFNSGTNTQTLFSDTSSVGGAKITNNGITSSTLFVSSATAGSATIVNSGAGSSTVFADTSSGGSAALVNANGTAFIDISQLTSTGTTAGSIAGNGSLFLGSKNLAVGGNNTNTTFSGVIQDGGLGGGAGGSLTKTGLGILTLTGVNTYTGNTTVNGGSLIINGSIASPNTFVNAAGLLGGTGIIGGNLINGGIVLPGNSPTGLTVTQNYTQTSGGDLRIPIASNSTFGKLKVGGTANLAGSVTAVSVNGFKPKAGDTFKFLTAGAVNGKFDELNDGIFDDTILSLGLIYGSNSVSLEVVQGSFGDFADNAGLTPNQKSVAQALDEIVFDSRERRLIEYLNGRSLSDLPGDFDLIAPDELTSIYNISFALANVQTLNLQRRTDDIRNGSNGFSAAGLAMQGTGPGYSGPVKFRTGAAGPTGSEAKDSKAVEPAADNRWGVFLSGIGEWIDVDGDGNARGYEIATGGFTVGIDYKVTPNFAVGLSGGYAGTGADLTGGGRVFVNGGKLGLYATYFDGGFYLDAGATGGYNSYDTKRSALQGTARGDTDGLEFNAVLGGGYDFKVGNWKIGPTATVQYTYVEIDEFLERGSLAPLRIVNQNAESLRTAVGFRTSYNIQLRNGIVIRPEVRASWQHEFADQAFALDSQFASGAGSVFTVNGPEYGRDSLLLSAGVAVQLTERTSVYLSYDGQLARRNYESHAISGGIRVAY